ncbi:MAG: hypothetical protein H6737_32175 [Alphaproteobacteria bacterium]|nr:hypothetical protein [Alphaproteobacteria bacterium]
MATGSGGLVEPARVYLDQNVYGHLLDSGDWKAHELGKELVEGQAAGSIQVWSSPTNAIETAMASDIHRRRCLAEMILTLTDGRRMLAGSDMLTVLAFGQFLNDVTPGAFDTSPFLDREIETSQLIWLGILARLASAFPVELGPGVTASRRTKRESHLLHHRIAADPDGSVQKIVAAASAIATTTNPDPFDFASMSDEAIEEEIAELKSKLKAPSQATIKLLQQNRAMISSRYGAIDVGGALDAVLGSIPCALQLTFDVPKIVKLWPEYQKKGNVPPLPTAITGAPPEQQRADHNIVVAVLNHCIRAAATVGLSITSVGYYTLLRELEVRMNATGVPTQGATLDVDHATTAFAVDIIVCHDSMLAANLKTFVAKSTHPLTVVETAKQLRKAIEKRA